MRTAEWRNGRYWDLVGICEDTRLSVSAIGTPFVAFLLDAKKMPTLTNPQLQIWLDTMASFCAFDEVECKKQPAMRKEYNQMVVAIAGDLRPGHHG